MQNQQLSHGQQLQQQQQQQHQAQGLHYPSSSSSAAAAADFQKSLQQFDEMHGFLDHGRYHCPFLTRMNQDLCAKKMSDIPFGKS
jgi:type II secretory pathway pseudopilin PulG